MYIYYVCKDLLILIDIIFWANTEEHYGFGENMIISIIKNLFVKKKIFLS